MTNAQTVHDLATPSVLIDHTRLSKNIHAMQAACDATGIELRPHIKTHKLVPVAKMQLAAGAKGLTCAKLGEAEAMLPSGVRSIFVAHSLVDPRQARRIAELSEQLDDLRVAVTSEAHADALNALAQATGKTLSVMMALDTGLGREGTRSRDAAHRLAGKIARSSSLELRGFYTHEGHFYTTPAADRPQKVRELVEQLCTTRDSIDAGLVVWPGCSVTAEAILAIGAGRVQAVRPGAYVFGDLALSTVSKVMSAESIALQVLVTVVDKPEPGLALIDAGSKTFSSDRTLDTIFAQAADGRDLSVVRVNEEHGYVRGAAVDALKIGERVLFTPAHVCTVVNLTDQIAVHAGDGAISATWRVDARGRTQ
ncbi:alanine racemase [Oleiharenicola lentus]|uniref:alanine racemase n=1 Tax=Oleiharenicola lentus TaxID=2508720 RepID=UPI003F6642FE